MTATRISTRDVTPLTESTEALLRNKRRGSCRIVLERWRNLLLGLVVPGETMNTRLDQDQTELGVLVLPVGLEVLANGDSLLHEVPEVLGDRGGKS